MTLEKLTDEQVTAKLEDAKAWGSSGGAIQRTVQFDDFVGAIAFVNKVAEAAEAADHHPDILIRYNKVTITLSTHDAGGITDRDFGLAAKIDDLAPAVDQPV